jgi:hypothetical protein
MNTEDKIKQIEILLAEVKAELKAEKQGIKLNTGEYAVYSHGCVRRNVTSEHASVNNRWKTEQQALQARNIMSAVFELKQLCDIFNEGRKLDFNDDAEIKYYLGYHHEENVFFMETNYNISSHGFYFSRDCLDEILPMMSDNLKAFIKGELQ